MVAGLPTQMHNSLEHPLGTLIWREKKNTRQELAMPPPVLSQAHWFPTSLQRLVLNHHDLCPYWKEIWEGERERQGEGEI